MGKVMPSTSKLTTLKLSGGARSRPPSGERPLMRMAFEGIAAVTLPLPLPPPRSPARGAAAIKGRMDSAAAAAAAMTTKRGEMKRWGEKGWISRVFALNAS